MRAKIFYPSILIIVIVSIVSAMLIFPKYRVYQKRLSGEARLVEATEDRKIKIEESKAIRESAIFLAEADSIRAEGTAKANKIISNSITDQFLKWKWIESLNDNYSEKIYIPTEAQIPILEAREGK